MRTTSGNTLTKSPTRACYRRASCALHGGLPALAGGSAKRAREHFDRAVALSEGQSAFAYLAMATSVAQPAKDRSEFERLLKAALAVDVNKRPALRLANLIAQKRAGALLARRAPQLF